jgi:4-hydroxybenzoate polyprenyltransferase
MLKILLKTIRVHQWVKNLLVFLPLVLTHEILDVNTITLGVLAFLSFSLIASAIYILNDIFDIESDRRDPIKCKRPLAAGLVSRNTGYFLALLLCLGSLAIASRINMQFIFVCITYAALVIIYSVFVKKVYVLDVVLLSMFYVIRVLAGAIAVGAEITNWLLAFSLFFFSSLAFIKRLAEMQQNPNETEQVIIGRNYRANDRTMIEIFGVTMGLISVLVMMLYIAEQQQLHKYTHPNWLWGVSVVMLYWVMRIWFMANRGIVQSDPIVHALKDGPTYVMALLSLVCIYLAI